MSNIKVTEGATGSIRQVGVDLVGTISYGQVKLVDATIGATLPIGVEVNPLYVNLPSGSSITTSGTSTVLGTVSVANQLATVSVGNTLPVTQSGAWTVAATISNFPASQVVSLASGSGVYKVDGSGYTQPVSGTVTANAGTGTFTVDGSGVVQPISATSLPTVSIGNYPATQAVSLASGSGVYKTDGSGYTQPISATSLPTISVGVMPAISIGTVSIGNYPATQAVSLASGSGVYKVDGSAYTQPISATSLPTVSVGNVITVLGSVSTTAQIGTTSIGNLSSIPTLSVGNNVNVTTQATVSIGNSPTVQGTISIGNTPNAVLASGSNLIGDVNLSPRTSGGWNVKSLINLTTLQTVSTAAGKFGGGSFLNLNSTPAFIQIFDTSGAITVGTTSPTFVQPIPANASGSLGAGFVLEIANGIATSNGFKVAATTTATGSTTVTTGLIGYIQYK